MPSGSKNLGELAPARRFFSKLKKKIFMSATWTDTYQDYSGDSFYTANYVSAYTF